MYYSIYITNVIQQSHLLFGIGIVICNLYNMPIKSKKMNIIRYYTKYSTSSITKGIIYGLLYPYSGYAIIGDFILMAIQIIPFKRYFRHFQPCSVYFSDDHRDSDHLDSVH